MKLSEVFPCFKRATKNVDTNEFYQKMKDFIYENISKDDFVRFIEMVKENETSTYALEYLDECLSIVKEE